MTDWQDISTEEKVEVTRDMIDRAAKYLRETNQAGKRLTLWDETPRATKRKWWLLAEGTLRAALPPAPRAVLESE